MEDNIVSIDTVKITTTKYDDITQEEFEALGTSQVTTLANGETVTVSIRKVNGANGIVVTIPNPLIEGDYQFEILKVDDDGNPIEGVDITIDGRTYQTLEDGTVTSKNVEVTGTGWITSEIEEISTDNSGDGKKYIKLADPISIYAYMGVVDYKYQLTRIGFAKTSAGTFVPGEEVQTLTKDVLLEDGTFVTVELSASLTNGVATVQLKIPNKSMDGKYGLQILKTDKDSGATLEGVKFTVDGYANTFETDSNGLAIIEEGKEISFINITEKDIYTITEIDVGNNNYITLNEDITIYITKGILNNSFQATGIAFSDSDTAKVQITKEATLKNGNTVEVSAVLENGVVKITIPNEKVADYNVKIQKIDADDNSVFLDETKFTIDGPDGNIITDTAVTDGVFTQSVTDVEVNTTYTYEIRETEAAPGYKNVLDGVYLKLIVAIDENGDIDQTNSSIEIIVEDNTLSDTEKQTKIAAVEAYIQELTYDVATNTVIVNIQNPSITGSYRLTIEKQGETSTKKLSGVGFIVNNKSCTTNSSGIAYATSNVAITEENLDVVDKYEISEVSVGINNYISLADTITVYVTKAKVDETYKVTGISFTEDGTPATSISTEASLKDGSKVIVSATVTTSNNRIKVIIPNKPITGEYTLKLKKVDRYDLTKVLSEATFKVVDENQTENTVETNASGIANIVENYQITEAGTDTYTITELIAPEGYNLIKYHSIVAQVKTGLNADTIANSTAYIPKSVVLTVNKTDADTTGVEEEIILNEETMLNNGLSYDITDNVITITIPDEETTDFNLKLQKVDADDNTIFLNTAKFTIDGPDGNIITNSTLTNGVYTKTETDKLINTEYTYEIRETQVPEGYQEVFKGLYLQVIVAIDENGKVNNTNSKINVLCEDSTLTAEEKAARITEAEKYIHELVCDTTTNTVTVTMENPQINRKFAVSLYKLNTATNKELSGAEFTLRQKVDGSTIYTEVDKFTTPITTNLIDLENIAANTEFYYELEETSIPAGFVCDYSAIRFKVSISNAGVATANITNIYNGTDWETYNAQTHSDIISINIDENNNVKVEWENSSEIKITLTKYFKTSEGETTSTEEASFKIEKIAPSANELYNDELVNNLCEVLEQSVVANTEYKYRITETKTPVGFSTILDNIPLLLTIKTDANGIILASETTLTIEDTTSLDADVISAIEDMINVETSGNNVSVVIDNFYDNYYQVQLIKRDKDGQERDGATFAIKLPDGTSFDADSATAGIQNPVTNQLGAIVLDLRDVAVNKVETYEFTEIIPPVGHKILEGKIVLDVNLTGVVSTAQLTEDKVSVKYLDAEGNETTLNGLETNVKTVNGSPIVTVIIPNEGKEHIFRLVKVDSDGNKVVANVTDGAYFTINRELISGDNIATGTTTEELILDNKLLSEGTYENRIGSYVNGKYTYTITEESTKDGLTNIFEGYNVILNVLTDGNGDVIDAEQGNENATNYKVIRISDNADVTSEFAQALKLNVTQNEKGEDVVEIQITNPTLYKLKLNKTKTNGDALDVATLTVYEVNSDNTNGTEYKLQDTNSILTSTRNIGVGETQQWKIYENATVAPYVNILGSNYVLVTVKNTDSGVVLDNYKIMDSANKEIASTNEIYSYVNVEMVEQDGYDVVNVSIKNPTTYNFELVKYNTNNKEITSANLEVVRDGETFTNNSTSTILVKEENVEIGEVNEYVIKELSVEKPYENVLEGKYIKVVTQVNTNGTINVNSFDIYDETTNTVVGTSDSARQFVSYEIVKNNGVETIQVKLVNPFTYKFKLTKTDSYDKDLDGASLEIEKGGNIYSNMNLANREITENNVKIGNKITYTIKEISAPAPYVNLLGDKYVQVEVQMQESGKVKVNYLKIFNSEDEEVDSNSKLYDYISSEIITEEGLEIVQVFIQNPVKYNVNINKTLYGTDGTILSDVKFSVDSQFSGIHELVTSDTELTMFEETAVSAGKYEYIITENETASEEFVNILENHYIKVFTEILPNGEIQILNLDGNVEEGVYYIYSKDNELVSFDETVIDEFISIDVTSEDDIYTLNVNIENPQKYEIILNKIEKDTSEKMNDVKFHVQVKGENNEKVELKNAVKIDEVINTENLITSTVEEIDGVIKLENILIEKPGKYTIHLIEEQPEKYKDVGELIIQYEIIQNGNRFEIINVEVVQDEYFVQADTLLNQEVQNIVIDVYNELIEGFYSFNIIKKDENENPIEDIKFNINADKDDLSTDENGEIYYKVKLEDKGWTSNVIKETDSQNASNGEDYIKLDEFTIYQYAEIIDNKYVITKIGFSDKEGEYIEVPQEGTATTSKIVSTENPEVFAEVVLEVSAAKDGIVEYDLNVPNTEVKGEYELQIMKINQYEHPVEGVIFTINDETTEPTDYDGILDLGIKEITEVENDDIYVISEVKVKGDLMTLKDPLTIKVHKERIDGAYYATEAYFDDDINLKSKTVLLEDGKTEVEVKISLEDDVVKLVIPNKLLNFDLALQKFITGVTTITEDENGKKSSETIEITDREPEFVNKEGKYEYHPEYDELEPVVVSNSDIVTYTIRVYNEGIADSYVAEIMDNIPEGLEFVPYIEGDNSINDKYDWVMYRRLDKNEAIDESKNIRMYDGIAYVETNNSSKAEFIRTEYLSKEAGDKLVGKNSNGDDLSVDETLKNPNLLKAFDSEEMESPDYRDVQVQFKVNYEAKTQKDTERIIVNYAEITDDSDKYGEEIKDEDSIPNEWNENEDDQDKEKIRVRCFDLALNKWVSEAIVIEDGVETVHPGNKETDNPEKVVKVDLDNRKVNDVTVKFKYQIKVTNEGEVAGYVKELSDYVPAGLKFVKEDNKEFKWVEKNGKLVTTSLENTLLQPGESATVTVILTWINGNDNLGLKVNIAEISEDYNDKADTPDIDSTPNNQVSDEDDIDDAPVMLAIRTGVDNNTMWIIVSLSALGIVAVGIVLVKKFVLE